MANSGAATPLVHRSTHSVKLGESVRFEIDYSPFDTAQEYASLPPKTLWVRVRNTVPMPLRAAYLAGPYLLYVDCRQRDYTTRTRAFVTADQPVFEPQLQPGQTFFAELLCHTFQSKYLWTVDVVSQIIFNNTIAVNFEVCIAQEREMLEYVVPDQQLHVTIHDTLDLWNLPLPDTFKPIHLVILTHGLHSNVSADMLFLKEQIDSSGDNVIVKGFFGNICKTERGIKYLGSRVAEYVITLLQNDNLANVKKISFVGHSLGGLVQTFAIAYLEANYPWVFEKIQPVNFITLASPMLGIIHENPAYVKLALLAGIVGRTGQDLGLQFIEKDQKPLLLLLPSGPTHRILRRFIRRTVYANACNDGIVPLRTAALLYLDYHGLSKLLGDQRPVPTEMGSGASTSAKIPHELPDHQDSQTLAVLTMMSYIFPQKQKPKRNPNPFQTKQDENTVEEHPNAIPKASMLESAASIILPPLPSVKYITDPESRENVVLHDKIYEENDLPKFIEKEKPQDDTRKKGMMELLQSKSEEFRQLVQGNTDYLEEEVAREYHKLMLWRKVIVHLKPDAHNNIVVRRRFSNSYGWPVIDHLVKNHFDANDLEGTENTGTDLLDNSEDGAELTRILSKDLIRKENEQREREGLNTNGDHAWINSQEKDGVFVGPAGLLSDLSEMVFNLKDQISSYGVKNPSEQVKGNDEEKSIDDKVIGDFI